jgi:hypothetical protein
MIILKIFISKNMFLPKFKDNRVVDILALRNSCQDKAVHALICNPSLLQYMPEDVIAIPFPALLNFDHGFSAHFSIAYFPTFLIRCKDLENVLDKVQTYVVCFPHGPSPYLALLNG